MLSLHAHNPVPPLTGHLPMGTAPDDSRPVRVDSRTLSRDGRPWLPVMGEFHFSRFPESLWRRELLLMRAGGIDLVATYLFWNHHEEFRGHYRFDGNRDIRRFVELCAEFGLAVSVRIGPWSHGECRNGGFPDWLSDVDCAPRTDDHAYLALVRPYYAAIAGQLAGLWWGGCGPVVAVQVENELYDRPGHLATLRALAEEAGIGAPLWTATGWGAAQLPPDVVLPLYGGYPEAFWEDATDGWAREVRRHYFPTPIRDDHAIGADLRTTTPAGSGPDDTRYPYATCELGGGMAIAYHRRPLIPAADVSALALTKLASGSVWQGYYLYHGCSQRLDLATTNQESHATGYPNDLPVVNYDFQAPLGEYGQVRPSFAALRLQHLFLRDCGADLAPAELHLPDEQPASVDDRRTPRWSVRWSGGPAFLFVNNHQPHEPLPDHHDVRFEIALGGRIVRLPARGVTIPSGAHFAWPIGHRVGRLELAWASAMPVARFTWDRVPTAVFVATAGITPQFAFPAGTTVSGAPADDDGVVTVAHPGPDAVVTATTPAGEVARLLVLDEENGLRLQRLPLAGVDTLVLCGEPVVADGNAAWVETTADQLDVSFLPAPEQVTGEPHGAFTQARLTVPQTSHGPVPEPVRAEAQSPPTRTGGAQRRASAPLDEDFGHAAVFHVDVPAQALHGDDEVLLVLGYTGDVARAYVGGRLVADHFWYGPEWEIGLRRFADQVVEHGVEIRILPRPSESAVYVDRSVRAQYKAALDTAQVDSVRLVRRVRGGAVVSAPGNPFTRRALLRGTLGAATVGALGACGSRSTTPITSGAVDLRIWTHDPGYVTTFTQAAADPAITGGSAFIFQPRTTSVAPGDIVTRLIAQAVADGNTPDLAGLVIDQFPRVMGSAIAENLFVDLTGTVAPFGDDLLKLAPYAVGGRPYGLDSDNSITVLYYRQDVFAERGVPEDVPTWEELAEHGERLARDRQVSLGMVSVGDNGAIVNGFTQMLLQRGGRVFDESGALVLDSPEAVEVLEFLARGVRTGFLLALPDPYGSACAAALKSGRLAATAMPNWYNAYGLQANVPDQKGRWRMRTLPRFAGGGHLATTLGGTAFTVVKDKPATQAALEFLRRVYLTREGQVLRYHAGGYLPTLRPLYRDPELLAVQDEYLGGQRVFDVYSVAADDLPLFHQAAGMQVLAAVLGGPVLDALRGRTSARAAIQAGIAAYRQQVKR